MTNRDRMYRKKGRALFLSAIMVLSVVALSSAFAGPAAAAVDQQNTERIINGGDTQVTNGTTVTVTVNGAFDASTQDAKLVDNIDGQGITDENVTITDADGGLSFVTSGPAVDITYDDDLNFGLGSESLTVEYELTIPEDTPVGTIISFDGNVTDNSDDDTAAIGGDTQIEVVEQPPPTATVEFTDQTVQDGSTSVNIANATFNGTEPFNVVVHQASDDNDDGTIQAREIGTKIGESAELNSGTRTDITVNISKQVDPNEDVSQLTANQTLVAMLHTTNTNDGDNIVHTAAITRGGTPVFDQAEITVSTNTDVTVGGQEVPAEFTSETDDGDQTVTADNAVEAINTFIAGDVSADVAVDVINAFIAS
jgi:surface glycoprotein (TIGR04207 family)